MKLFLFPIMRLKLVTKRIKPSLRREKTEPNADEDEKAQSPPGEYQLKIVTRGIIVGNLRKTIPPLLLLAT
jgi:hypothetical protein